jgi:hypothetical protein
MKHTDLAFPKFPVSKIPAQQALEVIVENSF